jgi:hypothetical protein
MRNVRRVPGKARGEPGLRLGEERLAGDPEPNVRPGSTGESYVIELDPEQSRQLLELANQWGMSTAALAKEFVLYGLANQRWMARSARRKREARERMGVLGQTPPSSGDAFPGRGGTRSRRTRSE